MKKSIGLLVFIVVFAQQALAVDLTMTTSGSPGGVYNQLAGDICKLFNGDQALGSCITRSSSGSLENIQRVNAGQANLGIVQSDVLFQSIESGDADNVSPIMGLYMETFLLIASHDSNIQSFADLAEKRVNIGPTGSGIDKTSRFILEKAGVSTDSFSAISTLSPFARETGSRLCSGEIDAMFYVSGTPNNSLHSLLAGCKVRLIGVPKELAEQIIAENKYFYSSVIPAGTYFDIGKIESVGVQAILIANNKNVSEEKGKEITKVLLDNMSKIKSNIKAMELSDERIFLGPVQLDIAFLKGAEDYYREKGIMKE